jgi:6-methylsalicylate decarboxylase
MSRRGDSQLVKPAVARRIDIHCHSMGPAYRQAISSLGSIIRTPEWSVELAIEFMERHGIQAAVLSLSTPGTHLGDDGKARDLARRCNEEFASFIANLPHRFGALATLPVPDLEGALREAEFALDVLKLDGVGLLSSYRDRYLGHPQFDPLLEFLNELPSSLSIQRTIRRQRLFGRISARESEIF